MRQSLFTAAIVLLAVLGPTGRTLADGPIEGTHTYRVLHDMIGDIGSHIYSFTRRGDELTVIAKVRIEAKILFITARRYFADRREIWRNGRLIELQSRTDDDGEISVVTAKANGKNIIVNGPNGRIEAPADIVTSSAWNIDFVLNKKKLTVLDIETGEILEIMVSDDGVEEIEANGGTVKARKFTLTGALNRTLWFGESGIWLKLRLNRGNDNISVVLH